MLELFGPRRESLQIVLALYHRSRGAIQPVTRLDQGQGRRARPSHELRLFDFLQQDADRRQTVADLRKQPVPLHQRGWPLGELRVQVRQLIGQPARDARGPACLSDRARDLFFGQAYDVVEPFEKCRGDERRAVRDICEAGPEGHEVACEVAAVDGRDIRGRQRRQ